MDALCEDYDSDDSVLHRPVKILPDEEVGPMRIMKLDFEDSKEIQYAIVMVNAIIVTVSNYGASILKMLLLDNDHEGRDCVLGFDKHAEYQRENPYFGATIDRAAEKHIGKDPKISKHHEGINRKYWKSKQIEDGVEFTTTEAKVKYMVRYTMRLKPNGEGHLKMEMNASLVGKKSKMKEVPVDLCNYSYFNLFGHDVNELAGVNLTGGVFVH